MPSVVLLFVLCGGFSLVPHISDQEEEERQRKDAEEDKPLSAAIRTLSGIEGENE